MTSRPPRTAKIEVSDNEEFVADQIKDLANALGQAEAAIDKLRSISEKGRHKIFRKVQQARKFENLSSRPREGTS